MADSFLAALSSRRSHYQLYDESPVSAARIEQIIQRVLLATPSAFSTQSTRVVVLYGDNHRQLWDITQATVARLVSPDAKRAATTNVKLAAFRAAHATVLFLEDPVPYESLGGFDMYADQLESWRDQTCGMHQLLIWMALSLEGLGGSLQHYNPLIGDEVYKA